MGMRVITKPLRRPKKTGAALRRREKVKRRRLIGLGLPESTVSKLNSKQMRQLLKRPARLKK